MGIKERHEELYRQIPSFECKKGCTDCCGPVPFSRYEWSIIADKREGKGLICPYASRKGCQIYDKRPLLCRLFGAVNTERMECPHGCKPFFLLPAPIAEDMMKTYIRELMDK